MLPFVFHTLIFHLQYVSYTRHLALVCQERAGTDSLLLLKANKLAWQFHNAVKRHETCRFEAKKKATTHTNFIFYSTVRNMSSVFAFVPLDPQVQWGYCTLGRFASQFRDPEINHLPSFKQCTVNTSNLCLEEDIIFIILA